MTLETQNVQIPAAEQSTPAEETNLQIEELEARVAPSAVWGS